MSNRRRLAVVILAVALGASGASVVAAPAGAATATATATWDARIKPIADEVAKLRGLAFKHPVPVKFLSETDFQKKVTVDDKLSKQDRADLKQSESEFRSIGLMAGGVDLLEAVNSFQTSGVLAFYSPKTKSVTVKGTEVDVSTRVTLAHELTHALQDQYFDLNHLEREARRTHSDSALKAVVEGDAVRVERLYEAQMSAADRAAYLHAQAADSAAAFDEIHAKGVPDSITAFFEAPYSLGPTMLALVKSQKADGIDKLFLVPPTTDASFLTPSTLVEGTKTVKVATPELAANEKMLGKPDVFGSFALYLMLASRGDAGDALATADGWGGDAMVTLTRGATTCVRAAFAGRTSADTTALAHAIATWAASMPGGTASSVEKGSVVTLTACDPGDATAASPNSSADALVLAQIRNEVLTEVVKSGLPVAAADCVATGLVRDRALKPIIAKIAVDPSAELGASDTQALRKKVTDFTGSCVKK